MLIKEYRIPLPLSVEEYRIAQLYMIAKKSREETKGAGSGVEILVNEPYEGGPGGDGNTGRGQYTRKIYHVGSHLPGWFKGLLPKSALSVEEEAWNAYPYTKTRYTCPFVEKFSLEIETYYYPDNGSHDNVFKLSTSELRNVSVDLIDIVKDQLYGADYIKEEDPVYYISEKTKRGPLPENWISEYWKECQNKSMPTASGKSIMCAYKLCKVEFRYWGMQTKIEKFIHEVALRKTMVRAHRQAWAWQDEWVNLSMDDIRQIEKQTQEALKQKMSSNSSDSEVREGTDIVEETKNVSNLAATMGSIEKSDLEVATPVTSKRMQDSTLYSQTPCVSSSSEIRSSNIQPSSSNIIPVRKSWSSTKSQMPSPGSTQSFDTAPNWRMESLVCDSDSELSNDDEFFDCQESIPSSEIVSLAKWSSLTILNEQEFDSSSLPEKEEDSIFSPTTKKPSPFIQRGYSIDTCPGSPVISKETNCQINVLLMIIHSGSVLDANSDIMAKKSDFTTFRGAFESVMRQHYPNMIGHVAMRLISCPSICAEGLSVLSKLSPYSFDVSPSVMEATNITHDSVPIGAIPILARCSNDYIEVVSNVIRMANQIYREFIKSNEGFGFNGRVYIIGDSMGSVIGYDALCRSPENHDYSRHSTPEHNLKKNENDECTSVTSGDSAYKVLITPPIKRKSSTNDNNICLEFEVHEMFMFASPLSLVLAFRKISAHKNDKSSIIQRPALQQIYNLFHPTDPIASRLEPLISAKFSILPPVNIPRYQKYPLGTGQPYYLLETVQTNPQLFSEPNYTRRTSEASILSAMSGIGDTLPIQAINKLTKKWWGSKRLDYALYCPDGLSNFPTNALPHIFHASYWESSDVIAFILRQFVTFDYHSSARIEEKELASFSPSQPREKWQRKTTFIKIKNSTASHRANDVIIREGLPQTISARFIYGPFDMFSLAGEKIDIHIIREPGSGEWTHLATEDSDKNGRVVYTIPENKSLGFGIYPVKMVVRGDHTSVDFLLAVVPPQTEIVVFSIDGSFSASVSVTGRDPKVRPGAVDIVRHWQDLGYLIVYITGRPDMQQQRVLSWLSQHNFPHGLVSFADGLSTDFLAHKITYLKNLVQDNKMIIHAAYGSSKDISVYSALDLKPKQIFIIGKVGRKHYTMATVLSDGYAAHLSALQCHGGSRPAQGNARMLLTPRGRFGQNASMRRRRSAKRTTSFPICSLTRTSSRNRYYNL
ncbi:protein retinal degeneration B isoform X2 [Daktulosphaira vitifoliae]|uniref:protein retinal degeneration B isoform X2 n=1 Tax=Daktulosphaira vitifoliae TaxID=58002 RepID=UPI0021AAD77F|nr:protein retinal degeneration B isoform X2 [Daktulosphaira vitifoliae]